MMRRFFAGAIICLTLLAFVAPMDASAQVFRTRLYGGWSNANFWGPDKILGSEDRNGFLAGAAVEYVREGQNELGYELGVAYIQKGAKGTIEPNEVDPEQPPFTSTLEGEVKLDYIELSLLFNFYLPIGAKTDLKLGVGPAFGMLSSAKAEGTLDGEPFAGDLDKYLTNVDFGIVLAAGLVYDLKKVALAVDARVDFGAISIDDTSEDHDLKTRAVGVVLGVVIPLGGK